MTKEPIRLVSVDPEDVLRMFQSKTQEDLAKISFKLSGNIGNIVNMLQNLHGSDGLDRLVDAESCIKEAMSILTAIVCEINKKEEDENSAN